MSDWTPISKVELWDVIHAARKRMSPAQLRLWNAVLIDPVKWEEISYGSEGGGFWVVGICGQTAIWFNDIEDGFNCSQWSRIGHLDEYRCDQDQLEWVIQRVLNEMTDRDVL